MVQRNIETLRNLISIKILLKEFNVVNNSFKPCYLKTKGHVLGIVLRVPVPHYTGNAAAT